MNLENQEWLNKFIDNHGRAPRILHIGNIANNAYRNAKFLNETGFVECDVICYDYYHLMAYPEWEDADIDGVIEDQFMPDFRKIKVSNFERPKWFAQGPLDICIKYLILKNKKNKKSRKYWELLNRYNKSTMSAKKTLFSPFINKLIKFVFSSEFVYRVYRFTYFGKISQYLKLDICRELFMIFLLVGFFPLRFINKILVKLKNFYSPSILSYQINKHYFIDLYQTNFPQRQDMLKEDDFTNYSDNILSLWERLFSYYDVIQAYATDPVIPLLCQSKIYIGYEHGTLRDFTLNDNSISRLTSLAYNNASHVFITNGDCLEYAKNIGVHHYSAMIHPIDEKLIENIESKYSNLHQQYNVKYLFLCTLRHDWAVKGTDIYIRALPELKQKLGKTFKVIMTKWGQQLEESMELAKSLQCDDVIEWIEPLPRKRLVQYKKSVDIVFDQIALPHFGATAPEAIACGTPVIMSYDPSSTKWIIPEKAPILSAKNAEDVVKCVLTALDEVWLKEYKIKAKKWFYEFHSSNIVIKKHLDVYKNLLK